MNQSEMIRSNGMQWKLIDLSPSKLGVWITCPAKFDYQYIKRLTRQTKIFFPQGTVVHYGAEVFLKDYTVGKNLDLDYYLLKMEGCWLDEIDKARGEIYDGKGNLLTESNLKFHFKECERWFEIFFGAVVEGKIKDFDPKTVKEIELDLMREVIHYKHGPLGVNIRGRIDWAIDLEGEIAKLADLKTASTHWMGRWSSIKADAQLQATCYGYVTGKDLEFSYVIIPKVGEKDRGTAKIEHYKTTRNKRDYMILEDIVYNFIKSTDVHNNYDGFVPYPNPSPSLHKHCTKLCDFQEQCYKDYFC